MSEVANRLSDEESIDDRPLIGSASAFPAEGATIIDVDGLEVGIYRTETGFIAIRNHCPHRGAPVCKGRVRGTMTPSAPGEYRYDPDKKVLVCPWHRWEFDLNTGKTAYDIDRLSLTRYEVIERDGQLYLGDRLRN